MNQSIEKRNIEFNLNEKMRVAHVKRRAVISGIRGRTRAPYILSKLIIYFQLKRLKAWIISWINPKKGKTLRAKAIQEYFSAYYKVRGLLTFNVKPLPPTNRGNIILTSRVNDHSSLYIYSIFQKPIIVPLTEKQRHHRLHPTKNKGLLTKELTSISYPDTHLASTLHIIKELFNKNYTVLVHINDGYFHKKNQNQISIYKELQELINTIPENQLYVLRCNGLENLDRASDLTPQMVRNRCETLKALREEAGVTQADAQIKTAIISKFLGCERVKIV